VACLDENTVVELMARRLPTGRRAVVHAHLDECEVCRALVAGAAGELTEAHSDDITTPTAKRSSAAPAGHLMLEPGAVVDHYRIVRLLGRGGMGEVYLALDTLLERKVALKMVQPELRGHEEAIDRFLGEARTTARLSHPSIVTIHAVGKHEGRPYVALELLTGQTLHERMQHGALGTAEALGVALAVARALEAAHAAGVCHRDLKPSNVMLCLDGRICVLDFGLAKVVDREALEVTWIGGEPSSLAPWDLSSSGAIGGTPAYMAPEQWRGEKIGGSADVWALGVMLYEACAGRRPFEPATRVASKERRLLELARAVSASEAAPPLAGTCEVPAALSALVARCLDKEAATRPTAAEMVLAIEALAAPVSRPPVAAVDSVVPPLPPAPRSRGRLPWAIAALGAMALGVLALVALRGPADPVAAAVPPVETSTPAATTVAAPPAPPPPSAPAPPATASNTPIPAGSGPRAPAAQSAEPWDPLSYR
jgi:serine/threonine protein kinase